MATDLKNIVVLAGGTGGAKLARAFTDLKQDDPTCQFSLTAICNVADDIEIYGGYVSPDPDLVTFWLANMIDERGWGIAGDTFHVMDSLRRLGQDIWFNLGDQDLGICLLRKQMLSQGIELDQIARMVADKLGAQATVIPASNQPIRTKIRSGDELLGIQEFLIKQQGLSPINDLFFEGIESATLSPLAAKALEEADLIVIGPSNPYISIKPIVEIPGASDLIKRAKAKVVVVSPIVDGQILKGPTKAFMQWDKRPVDAQGIYEIYQQLADALISDEKRPQNMGIPYLEIQTNLNKHTDRVRMTRHILDFAATL